MSATVRKTSITAYERIKSEGLLSKMRMVVYETIYAHGPITRMEISDLIGMHGGSVSARLTELRDFGTIEEVGERRCQVSDQVVIQWDVTGRLPVRPAKAERTILYLSSDEIERLQGRTETWRYHKFVEVT